jgi:hypothetical protein
MKYLLRFFKAEGKRIERSFHDNKIEKDEDIK